MDRFKFVEEDRMAGRRWWFGFKGKCGRRATDRRRGPTLESLEERWLPSFIAPAMFHAGQRVPEEDWADTPVIVKYGNTYNRNELIVGIPVPDWNALACPHQPRGTRGNAYQKQDRQRLIISRAVIGPSDTLVMNAGNIRLPGRSRRGDRELP
jgi:hypothetical protein